MYLSKVEAQFCPETLRTSRPLRVNIPFVVGSHAAGRPATKISSEVRTVCGLQVLSVQAHVAGRGAGLSTPPMTCWSFPVTVMDCDWLRTGNTLHASDSSAQMHTARNSVSATHAHTHT